MSSIKRVVSMLAAKDKITLFTDEGGMTVLTADSDYDISAISEYLTPKITGTTVVEIDIDAYSTIGKALSTIEGMDVEEEGIVVVQVINGKEVQGIFYPQKVSVAVAVGNDTVEIPHVENLAEHMKRAAKDNSPSVINFFKRIAPVIQTRGHSAEDLMKFIKRSEMPLTNDGCIIAYKRVNEVAGEPGYYVDVHSGKIKQRVGSRVTMPVDMVDKSRHNSCSTGLHVANLDYLRTFSGAKTLVVLVKPENFIAVPHGEDTKARVSSYDIIGVLDNSVHRKVCAGNHIEGDTSFEGLIKAAVEGNVIQPFEEIHVGQKEIIKVEPLTPAAKTKTKTSTSTTTGKSLLADKKDAAPVNVVAQTREAKERSQGVSIPEDVKAAFQKLVEGVSKTKVAEMFNTSTRSIGRWIEKYGDPLKILDSTPEESPQPVEGAKDSPQLATPVGQSSDAQDVPETLSVQARRYFAKGDFVGLKAFKKAKKKSWIALGFSYDEIGQIEKAA